MPTEFILLLEQGQLINTLSRQFDGKSVQLILIIIHDKEPHHWWMVAIDNKNQIYGEYDSVNRFRSSQYHFDLICKWASLINIDLINYRHLNTNERKEIQQQDNVMTVAYMSSFKC